MALTLPTSFDIDGVDWSSPDIFDFRVIYALIYGIHERVQVLSTTEPPPVISPGSPAVISTITDMLARSNVLFSEFISPETARTASPVKMTRAEIYQRWPLVVCPPAAGSSPQIFREFCSQLHDMLQSLIYLDRYISADRIYLQGYGYARSNQGDLETAWRLAANEFNQTAADSLGIYPTGREFEAERTSSGYRVTISGGHIAAVISNPERFPVLRSFYGIYRNSPVDFFDYDFGISFESGTIWAASPRLIAAGESITDTDIINDMSLSPPADLTTTAIDQSGGSITCRVDIASIDDISPGLQFK